MEKEQDRAGLCAGCHHSSVTRTAKGGVFYLCRLSQRNPAFPKYPPLPVRSCSGFEPIRFLPEPPRSSAEG